MQSFFFGGGGGVSKVHSGQCENGELTNNSALEGLLNIS